MDITGKQNRDRPEKAGGTELMRVGLQAGIQQSKWVEIEMESLYRW